jgi:hypothetical protein
MGMHNSHELTTIPFQQGQFYLGMNSGRLGYRLHQRKMVTQPLMMPLIHRIEKRYCLQFIEAFVTQKSQKGWIGVDEYPVMYEGDWAQSLVEFCTPNTISIHANRQQQLQLELGPPTQG